MIFSFSLQNVLESLFEMGAPISIKCIQLLNLILKLLGEFLQLVNSKYHGSNSDETDKQW